MPSTAGLKLIWPIFFLKKRDIFFTFMLIDFLLTLVLQFFRKSIMKKYIK